SHKALPTRGLPASHLCEGCSGCIRAGQGPGRRAQGPGRRAQGPGRSAQGPGRRAQGPGRRAQGAGPQSAGAGLQSAGAGLRQRAPLGGDSHRCHGAVIPTRTLPRAIQGQFMFLRLYRYLETSYYCNTHNNVPQRTVTEALLCGSGYSEHRLSWTRGEAFSQHLQHAPVQLEHGCEPDHLTDHRTISRTTGPSHGPLLLLVTICLPTIIQPSVCVSSFWARADPAA
ncbi:hypothetical protein KUCAC02_009270, partial [Chaenocephalus aceratus]